MSTLSSIHQSVNLAIDPHPDADFPVDCLPGVSAAMARHAAGAALVPQSLTGAAILGTVSAALGSGLEVESGGNRRTRGNLFLLPLAATGTGKDLAYNLVASPYHRIEQEARERWKRDVAPGLQARVRVAEKKMKTLETQAAKGEENAILELEDALREWEKAKTQLQGGPLFIVTDATREALAADMATQAGEALALMTAEGRGALSIILGRYTKGDATDEDLYCAGFSGTAINQRRRTRDPVVLKRPCLSLLLMVQPDVWTRLAGMEVMVASGLLPRFLTFDTRAEPELLPPVPHVVPDEVGAAYDQLIQDLVETYRLYDGEPLCIRCPLGAYDLLRDFDNHCRMRRRTGGDVHDIPGFAARWAEQAWRISVSLHAMSYGGLAHEHPLAEETAQNAIRLARWFIDQQLVLLEADRCSRNRDRKEKLVEILEHRHCRATFRELRDRHGFTHAELTALARDFPKIFTVTKEKPAIGRPSEVMTITPKL